MSIVETDGPMVNSGSSVNTTIPTPLFSRYSPSEGERLAVHIVGCEEDLQSIGPLPTFNDVIDWRFVRADKVVEADALIRLVIWNASFAESLPIFMNEGQQRWPFLIAYRTTDAPPPFLNGRPTSRLRFEGSITSLLRRLVHSLIIPEAFEGLICVAYEDLAGAVSRGGEMLQFFRRGEELQSIFAFLLPETKAHLETLGPKASICIGMLAGSQSLTMKLVDEIMHEVFEVLHPDIFVVVSAVAHPDSEVFISLLTTSGDFYVPPCGAQCNGRL